MSVDVWLLPLGMGRFGDSAWGGLPPILLAQGGGLKSTLRVSGAGLPPILLAQGMDAPGTEWFGLLFFLVLPLGTIRFPW